MEEALEDFLAAYEKKPNWIENLIYIIRIYNAKNDKVLNFFSTCRAFIQLKYRKLQEHVKKYCNKLLAITPTDEDERDWLQEAKKILAKC
ncbi:unnamed protein product [Strongylus vulgaris]|uniref:Uncharacterized protein n=1 Tax=Strongylus vulgaris TaxID=40348 RepID=A0A3P7ILI1_STRVU|nr:unnamed protein product [Strongylus vulgaris]